MSDEFLVLNQIFTSYLPQFFILYLLPLVLIGIFIRFIKRL